jgi:hypothetical protein
MSVQGDNEVVARCTQGCVSILKVKDALLMAFSPGLTFSLGDWLTKRNLRLLMTQLLRYATVGPSMLKRLDEELSTSLLLLLDVEDDQNRASNDITKRICKSLDQLGVRANILITGEKIRFVNGLDQTDVLKTLAHHDVAYHSNRHSTHPTIPEYTKSKGWSDALTELERYETPGLEEFRARFKRNPASFGCPGDAWVPYVSLYCRVHNISSEVYTPIDLPEKPVSYMGILDYGRVNLRYEVQRRMIGTHIEKVIRDNEGSLVLLRAHPSKFAFAEWWDRRNWHGATRTLNTQTPLALKAVKKNLANFNLMISRLLSMRNVKFRTFSELGQKFGNHVYTVTDEELSALALLIRLKTFPVILRRGGVSYAEALYFLAKAYLYRRKRHKLPNAILLKDSILGPLSPVSSLSKGTRVSCRQFVLSIENLLDSIQLSKSIPPTIMVGKVQAGPGDVLETLSNEILRRLPASRHVNLKKGCSLPPGNEQVYNEKFLIHWRWKVLPRNFTMPLEFSLARLQSWSLKATNIHSLSN